MRRIDRLGAIAVVALCALGVMAKGPISLERMLTGALFSSGGANRALAEPTEGSTDRMDDIHLEILEPYVVLPVPHQKYGLSTGMSIDMAITNQGETPVQIAGGGLVAQLVAADGAVLPLKKSKEPSAWCFSLSSGEIKRLSAQLDLFLDRSSRQLDFSIYDGTRTGWDIEGISPETYRLSYAYSEPTPLASDCPEAATVERGTIQEGVTEPTAFDSVEVRIVEPREIDRNTVEVDGVRFEIIMPERVLRIPENEPDANTKMELGIRITNQTQTPLRFTRFDTLALSIVKPNGERLKRSGARNWTLPPRKADVPLIKPGKSATFFLDAQLFWEQNQLRLGGSDGFGGYWYFDSLESKTYLFSMGYVRPDRIFMYDEGTEDTLILEEFWEGWAESPFVEVRIVKR